MSRCLVGRTAVLALRKSGGTARKVTLVFPGRWQRSTLLRYVRREHPNETVRILEWHSTTSDGSWEPDVWIVNPAGFTDYALGRIADA